MILTITSISHMNRIVLPFQSFKYQTEIYEEEIIKAVNGVIKSKQYVLGKELQNFEKNYSHLTGVKYTVGVGSGLDALIIALKSLNIGPDDEVIVPSNTYIATWLAVSMVGAKIVPVEPRESSSNINPNLIEDKITKKTKVIVPVHLYGQSCEMEQIMKIANKYNIYVVEDNAQSQLAKYKGKLTGSFGHINATSFYPTKNLGAMGEAGAITTNNFKLSKFASRYRNYGSDKKYFNEIKGINSRLDEIQAAILNIKIKHLDKITKERVLIANKIIENLKEIEHIDLPISSTDFENVFHIFNIRTKFRDELANFLSQNGISTSIHYPIPPHLQKAYTNLGFKIGDFPIAEKLSKTSLSLPFFPGMTDIELELLINKIKFFFNKKIASSKNAKIKL